MAYFFIADTQKKNFPVDEDDLKARLAKIETGLPQQGDNVKAFVIPAFELFRDCGLITKENLYILQRKCLVWTEENSWRQKIQRELDMNPIGGVIRREDLPMYDDSKRKTSSY